jgi:hypothetical protein
LLVASQVAELEAHLPFQHLNGSLEKQPLERRICALQVETSATQRPLFEQRFKAVPVAELISQPLIAKHLPGNAHKPSKIGVVG